MIDINELKRLHEAATPGPWQSDEDDINSTSVYANIVADCPSFDCEASREKWDDNRALITYLRNHVSDILAVLEKLNEG
jgi:hypothetical protein